MKRIILFAALVCMVRLTYAQTNPIDQMFDKYSERKGFTTVFISSKLLGMFAPKDEKGAGGSDIVSRIKSIRILSVEDSLLNQSVNFYKELTSKLDLSQYEELMAVKDAGESTKFLIKQKGNVITELLVITGGTEGNTLISIRGEMDLKTISDLSKSTGIDELRELDNIEKNKE